MISLSFVLTQAALVAIVLLQMGQNRRLTSDLQHAALNSLCLSTRLDASLGIAGLFMAQLSKAENTDHAQFCVTKTAAHELHRAYYYATTGEPMTEEV